MSDQEIAKGLGFLRLVDSTLPQDWICLRNHSGEACSHSELTTRPASDRAFIHVTYDERLKAILCSGAGSCSPVALKTKEANHLVFQSGKAGSWGSEALYVRRTASGALVGQYFTRRSTIILDYGVYADWKVEVELLKDTRGPAATFGGRWALDPLGIGFDQPVRCDSLAISVFDSTNQRVPFSMKTLCEDQHRLAGLRGTTPRVWVYPQMAWEQPSYRLVVDRAIGLSGKSLAAPQMSSVRLADSAMTATSLDFEEEQPQGWHARPPKFPSLKERRSSKSTLA